MDDHAVEILELRWLPPSGVRRDLDLLSSQCHGTCNGIMVMIMVWDKHEALQCANKVLYVRSSPMGAQKLLQHMVHEDMA